MLQIEIVGTGEIPADVALRFRSTLMERSLKTRIVTNARSSLQGGSVLLWLLGDSRTIRDDARLYFRRTSLSEEDEVQENGVWKNDEPQYRDSYSWIDPEEGDYARVLQLTTECSSSEFSVSGAEARDLRVEPAVDTATLSTLRRRAVLEGCKWDPQVGDVDTLTPFPLVLKRSVWNQIASQAERLTQEAVAAEEEISRRPELLKQLSLPTALCRVLAEEAPMTPAAGRVIRFDFHHTTQGWHISEANSDVPGGLVKHPTSLE